MLHNLQRLCWFRAPERRAGNPGPGENFSLKLTTQDLPDDYSESQIFIKPQ